MTHSDSLWQQAIAEAAAHSAEQERLHPGLMKDWTDEIEKRMFGDDDE